MLKEGTWEVVSRPFHKFFNIYEHAENRNMGLQAVELQEAVVLEKIDGMMVRTVLVDGDVCYCSKAGKMQGAVQRHSDLQTKQCRAMTMPG